MSEVAIDRTFADGVLRAIWTCPCNPNQQCGVPVLKNEKKDGFWKWTGDEETPTLTPSVNCNGAGGCGWHGQIFAGNLVTVEVKP